MRLWTVLFLAALVSCASPPLVRDSAESVTESWLLAAQAGRFDRAAQLYHENFYTERGRDPESWLDQLEQVAEVLGAPQSWELVHSEELGLGERRWTVRVYSVRYPNRITHERFLVLHPSEPGDDYAIQQQDRGPNWLSNGFPGSAELGRGYYERLGAGDFEALAGLFDARVQDSPWGHTWPRRAARDAAVYGPLVEARLVDLATGMATTGDTRMALVYHVVYARGERLEVIRSSGLPPRLARVEIPKSTDPPPSTHWGHTEEMSAVATLLPAPEAEALRGADLTRVDLKERDLSHQDLSGARLVDADLRGAKLDGTRLAEAVLYRASLQGASLNQADLSRADLGESNLDEGQLEQARLDGADLSFARLPKAALAGAQMRDSSLYGALLLGSGMQGADLRGSDLRMAIIGDARLSGADLRSSDLRGARMSTVDLAGARLEGADLRGADLSAARGLDRRQLSRACLDEDTSLPPGFEVPDYRLPESCTRDEAAR